MEQRAFLVEEAFGSSGRDIWLRMSPKVQYIVTSLACDAQVLQLCLLLGLLLRPLV